MPVPELCLSLPTGFDLDPETLFSLSPDVCLAPESFKALDDFSPPVVSLVPVAPVPVTPVSVAPVDPAPASVAPEGDPMPVVGEPLFVELVDPAPVLVE